MKYALSFPPAEFRTAIQLRFRTREEHGELFRVSDQHNREWCILEISDAKLRFRSVQGGGGELGLGLGWRR